MGPDKPLKSNVTEDRRWCAGITGTGAADPTKRFGPNITVTRTATGVYKFTFSKNPGYFKGFKVGFGADTPADVKGFTCTRDTFITTDNVYSVSLSVWNGSATAANLEALQYLDVEFQFSESGT